MIRRLLHFFEPEEASLEEIQARLRTSPVSREFVRCSGCQSLVRGAHDCPTTPEKLALLRFLFVRLSLRKEKRQARELRNVVQLQTVRRKAGR
jgi:hypothetical protein